MLSGRIWVSCFRATLLNKITMKILIPICLGIMGTLQGQVPTVSLIELIASPREFDGKVVRFHGVINIDFENTAIYLSKEHWSHSVTSCGIWLDLPEKLANERKWGNGKYFIIQGTFNAAEKGHMGLWRGGLSNIAMLDLHEVNRPPSR